jgi:hypothetical protein
MSVDSSSSLVCKLQITVNQLKVQLSSNLKSSDEKCKAMRVKIDQLELAVLGLYFFVNGPFHILILLFKFRLA